jgi:hypothetical protein
MTIDEVIKKELLKAIENSSTKTELAKRMGYTRPRLDRLLTKYGIELERGKLQVKESQ